MSPSPATLLLIPNRSNSYGLKETRGRFSFLYSHCSVASIAAEHASDIYIEHHLLDIDILFESVRIMSGVVLCSLTATEPRHTARSSPRKAAMTAT